MECTQIIYKLQAYRGQLRKLLGDVDIQISSQYSFINAEILRGDKPSIHVKFLIDDVSGKLEYLYCDDKDIESEAKSKISSASWAGLKSEESVTTQLSTDAMKSINTADKIAAVTSNCATGDNYRPGNFSKVLLTNEFIELSQVNHMNAKSLAHKKDYSLRDLIFTIPLSNVPKKKKFGEEQIGMMAVYFEDRSSDNNKKCGDRISEAIAAAGSR